MPTSLVYRTTDNTRWGGGRGSDLSATTIDLNFWTLADAIQNLEDAAFENAGIDYISQPVGGNIFYVHLTDHRVLGPFTLPTAQWNPRGIWAADTGYQAFDTIQNNGQLYLVAIAHTSGDIFSEFSTDGLGHNLYVLILSAPSNTLPAGGTLTQRLVKANSDDNYITAWASDRVRMHVFVSGPPNPSETLIQYTVTDNMTLPAGLEGTVVFSRVQTQSNVSYSLYKNDQAIGSIDFEGPSPEDIVVSFAEDVTFIPTDVFTLVGPLVPDVAQSDISFTIIALLT